MADAGTRSVEAYRNYIQGRAFGTTSRPEAYAFFERARELDPGFAAAHYNAALYWQFQGNPTVLSRTATELGLAEIRRRFAARIEAAIETASDPLDAVLYRAVEAREQLRLSEAVALFRRYVGERPGDFPAWLQTLELAYMVGDDVLHEQALAVFWERSLSDRVMAIHYLVHAYRAQAPEEWIDHAYRLATRWPDAVFVQYQVHRALLWAGRVAEAREFHDRLLLMDLPPQGKLVLQIRQACAEGRVSDAVALFEDDAEAQNDWFVLGTLSRNDEADAALRQAEIENGTHGLLNFLLYPQFDARRIPSLVRMLEREGIEIREPKPIPFACSRGGTIWIPNS
jgi:tetratricopeptide (TPR) repeat protein